MGERGGREGEREREREREREKERERPVMNMKPPQSDNLTK